MLGCAIEKYAAKYRREKVSGTKSPSKDRGHERLIFIMICNISN